MQQRPELTAEVALDAEIRSELSQLRNLAEDALQGITEQKVKQGELVREHREIVRRLAKLEKLVKRHRHELPR